MDRSENWPVLNDEFVERFCELQQELAQLRSQAVPQPVVALGPDPKTLAELAETERKLQQAIERTTTAEQTALDWRSKYESAAARVDELLTKLTKLSTQEVAPRAVEAPRSSELEDLRQQLIEMKEQRNTWKRRYEDCRDERNGNS